MKLMSMKQYSKMTKASLVRKIMKALKKLPKTKLVKLCYELEKRRLPTISTTKKGMPRLTARRAFTKKRKRAGEPFRKKDSKYVFGLTPRMVKGTARGFAQHRAMNRRKKPRSPAQRANDKRLGLMAKRRARAKRRSR